LLQLLHYVILVPPLRLLELVRIPLALVRLLLLVLLLWLLRGLLMPLVFLRLLELLLLLLLALVGLRMLPIVAKGGPVKGLVLDALWVTYVEWDLLLKDNIRAGDLPKGGAVKEKPAGPLGVDANKNCWLGDGTKFASLGATCPFVEQYMAGAAPHAKPPKLGTALMPCLVGRYAGKHAMRDEVGKSGCMKQGVAPQVMRCATLHQTGARGTYHRLVACFSHAVLLWRVRVGERECDAVGFAIGAEGVVEEFTPPVSMELLELESMLPFLGCNPIKDALCGLPLGSQQHAPSKAGVVVDNREAVAFSPN
jgi:hypothetical protein